MHKKQQFSENLLLFVTQRCKIKLCRTAAVDIIVSRTELERNMKKQELIEQDIIRMITQCIFSPGDRLPSIRELSKRYGVSISPVKNAYNRLMARHWIEAHPRSGYYVSEAVLENPEIRERDRFLRGNFSERFDMLDTMSRGFGRSFNARGNISVSLGSGSASTSFYPCADFAQHISRYLNEVPNKNSNLQSIAHDSLDLKKQILKWLGGNGLDFGIDTLSIVPNASLATLLALRAVAEPGGVVAVESPGHAGFYFFTTMLNYQVVPVLSDPVTGLNVDQFEQLLRRGPAPSCLLLSSTFSCPTGAVMPEEAKRRLTSLCAQFSVPIIEDDVMGCLYYGKGRPQPLKSFDRENVIYISSFSKVLTPEYRLGYVCAGKYSGRFAFYKHLMVAYALHPVQYGMASFLRSGSGEKNIRLFRRRLSMLKDSYRELIAQSFPAGTEVSNPAGGYYLWVTLPKNADAEELSSLAENYGISISPACLFGAPPSMKSSFRLNIAAAPWNGEARAAVNTLGQLACSVTRKASRTRGAAGL